MGIFFAKFRNGEVKQFDVAPKTVEKKVQEYEFDADINYSEVEYLEFPMHDFPILAGDEGFFLIPAGNKGDLEEVDSVVKENIEFVYAEKLSDVLDVALEKTEPKYIKPKRPAEEKKHSVVHS